MKLKFLVVILIVGLVILSVYYTSNNKKVSEQDMAAVSMLIENNLTVAYTNEGFIPAEIKIKKGQSIKFINKSDRKMWVASDDHPNHEIYPEFDQKDIGLRDSTYEFKFDKIGNWGYHNHMFDKHKANVIVEEN